MPRSGCWTFCYLRLLRRDRPKLAQIVLEGNTPASESQSRTREKLRQQLREGKLDDRQVEIETRERNFPSFEIISNQGVEEMDVNWTFWNTPREAEDEGTKRSNI